MDTPLLDSICVRNTLGEGVVWDNRSQSVWWTDIQESRLYNMAYPGGEVVEYSTPERLCCFALTQDPNKLLVAFASGFAFYEYRSGNLQWLYRPQELQPGSGRRLNDGRVDRHGRFWVGAMIEDEQLAAGGDAFLYCLDSNGKLSVHKKDISISNGMCWSPDNDVFYFADSPKQRIYAYKYDIEGGTINSQTVFSSTPQGHYPDGAVTDSQGYYWCAHWGGHCVVRYSPQGNVDQIIDVPASQPSCVAFGGKDMTTLFVTSARQDLSPEQLAQDPQAGNLFVLQTPVKGIAEPLYNIEMQNN